MQHVVVLVCSGVIVLLLPALGGEAGTTVRRGPLRLKWSVAAAAAVASVLAVWS